MAVRNKYSEGYDLKAIPKKGLDANRAPYGSPKGDHQRVWFWLEEDLLSFFFDPYGKSFVRC